MRLAWPGVAAVCLLALPLTALRAQTVPAAPAEASMPRPVVAFDPAQTQASFEVSLRVPMRAVGHFTRVSGQMQGDAGAGWTVLVQVDGASLRFEGPAWMDRVTRSEAFLALDRYPEIRFASAGFTDTVLHAGGALRGAPQPRGRRRPVTFPPLAEVEPQIKQRLAQTKLQAYQDELRKAAETDYKWSEPAAPAQ